MADNTYPVNSEPYIIEQVPANERNTLNTTALLDSSVLVEDKVFEGIVKAISPEVITAENKALIDSFVDILAEASPISVNIVDFFSKNPNVASMDKIQDELANMYLQNFHYVWNKAKNDYNLKNKLENLLKQYRALTGSIDEGDFNFFGNEDELYTTERYILAKEFKEKKGTETAIEYAYRVGWLANIEGPLRTEYDFNITTEVCKGFDEGFYICDDAVPTAFSSPCSYNSAMYPPLTTIPDEPGSVDPGRVPQTATTTGYSKLINTFMISDSVEANPCFPFRYVVEGSMIPDFFEAFVIPLAHPAGFRYIYTKLFKTAWIDYFNVELIYRADEVYVSTLCPGGDCNLGSSKTLYGAPQPEISITNSQWRTFEEGKLDYGKYAGTRFEKYTFENSSYLIQYSKDGSLEATERTIEYYDVPKIRTNNILRNGDFEERSAWRIEGDGSAWSIGGGVATSTNAMPEDRLSQSAIMTAGKNYLIEVEVTGASYENPVVVSFGKWELFEETLNSSGVPVYTSFNPKRYEEPEIHVLTEDILYDFDYIARGGEVIYFYTQNSNTYVPFTFTIDNILVVEYEPTTTYTIDTHSIIGLINPALPIPLLYTHDIFGRTQGMHYFPSDDMNDLYYKSILINTAFYDSKIGPLIEPDSPLNNPEYNWNGEGLGSITGGAAWSDPVHTGNMVINEFHYGQAKYKTTGAAQLVDELHIGDTIDYAVATSVTDGGGNLEDYGDINTRYIYKIEQPLYPVDYTYIKDGLNGADGIEETFPIGTVVDYTYVNNAGAPESNFKNVYVAQTIRTDIILWDEDFLDTNNWIIRVIDLNEINFKDENFWTVFLVNIDPDQEVESITNEGGFVIGGKIIPWGDPQTAYMRDDISIERNNPEVWEPLFFETDKDFKNPLSWEQHGLGRDWDIIESGIDNSTNYANCDYDYGIDYVFVDNRFTGTYSLVATNDISNTPIDPPLLEVTADTVIEYTLIKENPPTYTYVGLTDEFGIITLDTVQTIVAGDVVDHTIEAWDGTTPAPGGGGTVTHGQYVALTNQNNVHFNAENMLDTNNWKVNTGIKVWTDELYVALVDEPATTDINGFTDMRTIDVGSSDWIGYYNGRRDISLIQRDLDIFPPAANDKTLVEVEFTIEFDKTDVVNNNSYLDFTLGTQSDYTYTVYSESTVPSKTVTLFDGYLLDFIYIDVADDYNLFKKRYKSLTARTVDLADEYNNDDFNDPLLWEELETNNIFRYQKSQQGKWMGYYRPGDKFIFGASTNFKGKITSFNGYWKYTSNVYDVYYLEGGASVDPVEDVKTSDIVNYSYEDLMGVVTINTYKSLNDRGLIGLLGEDYSDTENWELIFTNKQL